MAVINDLRFYFEGGDTVAAEVSEAAYHYATPDILKGYLRSNYEVAVEGINCENVDLTIRMQKDPDMLIYTVSKPEDDPVNDAEPHSPSQILAEFKLPASRILGHDEWRFYLQCISGEVFQEPGYTAERYDRERTLVHGILAANLQTALAARGIRNRIDPSDTDPERRTIALFTEYKTLEHTF